MAKHNPVESPRHYRGNGKIEAMDALESMTCNAGNKLKPIVLWWWCCAFKYLWRWPWKNGKEDLKKCKQCIDYILEGDN